MQRRVACFKSKLQNNLGGLLHFDYYPTVPADRLLNAKAEI